MTRVRMITPAIVVLAVAAALAWWSMPAAAQMPVEVPDVLGEEEDESSEEQASEEQASEPEPTEEAAGAAPTDGAAEIAPAPAPDPAPAPEEPQPPEPQEPTAGEAQPAEPQPSPVRGMASGPRLQSRPMPDGPAPAESPDGPVQAPQVAGPEANPGVSVAPPEGEEPAAAEPGADEPETTESMGKISVASGGPSGGASGDGQRQAMPTLAVLIALTVGLAWNDRRQRSRIRRL